MLYDVSERILSEEVCALSNARAPAKAVRQLQMATGKVLRLLNSLMKNRGFDMNWFSLQRTGQSSRGSLRKILFSDTINSFFSWKLNLQRWERNQHSTVCTCERFSPFCMLEYRTKKISFYCVIYGLNISFIFLFSSLPLIC